MRYIFCVEIELLLFFFWSFGTKSQNSNFQNKHASLGMVTRYAILCLDSCFCQISIMHRIFVVEFFCQNFSQVRTVELMNSQFVFFSNENSNGVRGLIGIAHLCSLVQMMMISK